MAPRIANFAEWARHVLNAIAAELDRSPDAELAARHAELSALRAPGPARTRATWASRSRSSSGRGTVSWP